MAAPLLQFDGNSPGLGDVEDLAQDRRATGDVGQRRGLHQAPELGAVGPPEPLLAPHAAAVLGRAARPSRRRAGRPSTTVNTSSTVLSRTSNEFDSEHPSSCTIEPGHDQVAVDGADLGNADRCAVEGEPVALLAQAKGQVVGSGPIGQPLLVDGDAGLRREHLENSEPQRVGQRVTGRAVQADGPDQVAVAGPHRRDQHVEGAPVGVVAGHQHRVVVVGVDGLVDVAAGGRGRSAGRPTGWTPRSGGPSRRCRTACP